MVKINGLTKDNWIKFNEFTSEFIYEKDKNEQELTNIYKIWLKFIKMDQKIEETKLLKMNSLRNSMTDENN